MAIHLRSGTYFSVQIFHRLISRGCKNLPIIMFRANNNLFHIFYIVRYERRKQYYQYKWYAEEVRFWIFYPLIPRDYKNLLITVFRGNINFINIFYTVQNKHRQT